MDWSPLFISLKTAVVATIITFFLGIFTAQKVLRVKTKLAWIIDGLFTLPLVLPPTVAGFFLLILFGKKGVIGGTLESMGIEIVFTWYATVIAAVVISFPLMYRSAKAAFEQVDQNLVYAGRTLGMSEIKIFWKVIMPLSLPGIASGGILSFSRAIGEFGATIMIAGNIPKITQTMPVAIYMAVQGNNIEKAKVWVGIIVAIALIAILLMNFFAARRRKYMHKGENQ
ncbi:MAG: modB [Clostridiales bacterium]|jgi:molybdate transport system permease protein|nr:modB [Clostridiales bacterium]